MIFIFYFRNAKSEQGLAFLIHNEVKGKVQSNYYNKVLLIVGLHLFHNFICNFVQANKKIEKAWIKKHI